VSQSTATTSIEGIVSDFLDPIDDFLVLWRRDAKRVASSSYTASSFTFPGRYDGHDDIPDNIPLAELHPLLLRL